MPACKAACNVHTLLLSTREGRRRQTPQSFRQVQARQQYAGPFPSRCLVIKSFARGAGHDFKCRDARDHAQELADLAHRRLAQGQHMPGWVGGDIDPFARVFEPDATAINAVVAVNHFRIDDLPLPDGPPSTTHSPPATSKSTPRTTGSTVPPRRCMVKLLDTSSSLITVSRAHIAQPCRTEERKASQSPHADCPPLRRFIAQVYEAYTH